MSSTVDVNPIFDTFVALGSLASIVVIIISPRAIGKWLKSSTAFGFSIEIAFLSIFCGAIGLVSLNVCIHSLTPTVSAQQPCRGLFHDILSIIRVQAQLFFLIFSLIVLSVIFSAGDVHSSPLFWILLSHFLVAWVYVGINFCIAMSTENQSFFQRRRDAQRAHIATLEPENEALAVVLLGSIDVDTSRRLQRLLSSNPGIDLQRIFNSCKIVECHGSEPPSPQPSGPADDTECDADVSIEESITLHRNQMTCVICLEDFAEGHRLLQLTECRHVFHPACLVHALLTKNLCPYCRARI